MKNDQYRIDYYHEMLSIAFDENSVFDIWDSLSKEKRESISDAIVTSVENQSMAFGYVDTRGPSYEEKQLKYKIKELEREVEEWREGFKRNVATRRGWDKNEIIIEKDGSAYVK